MKLIMMVGPCGSGKTTLAKGICALNPGTVYVNQDSQNKEHLKIFFEAIKDKKDVVIDRLNFNIEQRQRYLKPAKEAGYETEIQVLHENRETCFKRCVERKNHHTITNEQFANNAINMFFSKYERVEDSEADLVIRHWPILNMKLNAVWFDLDGTMCDIQHRQHFVSNGLKDWKNFLHPDNVIQDKLNNWCKTIVNALRPNHNIILCSGRPDNLKEVTEEWLEKNNIHYDWLFMRNRENFRQDDIVKENILDFEILTRFNLVFAIDDRDQVVKMLRRRGIVCLQCNYGSF